MLSTLRRPPEFVCPICEGPLNAERFAHVVITFEVDPRTGAISKRNGEYGEPDLTDEIILRCPNCDWTDNDADRPQPFLVNTTAMNDSAWITMREVTDG